MYANAASAHEEGMKVRLKKIKIKIKIRSTAQEAGLVTLPWKNCNVQYESLVMGAVQGLLASSFSRFYRVQTMVCQ